VEIFMKIKCRKQSLIKSLQTITAIAASRDLHPILENVKMRIGGIAPIALYPSVNDVEALAMFGYKISKAEIEVKEYI